MKAKFQSCEDSGVKIAFKLPSGEKTCHVFSRHCEGSYMYFFLVSWVWSGRFIEQLMACLEQDFFLLFFCPLFD